MAYQPYTLVNAVLKPKGANTKYQTLNIGNVLVKDIINHYSDGWIELSNTAIIGRLFLQLNDLKALNQKMNTGLTFNNWLGSLNVTINSVQLTLAIPNLTNTEPELETKKILYSDAIKARYDIQRVHPVTPPPNNYPLGDLTDLLITKVGVIHSNLYENAIFSVNGLFHIADLTGYGVKIKDGGKSTDVSNLNNVGIISFREIGTIEYVPVDSLMITKPDPMIHSKQSIWLDTGVDMSNKTAILVLGGYLHVCDPVYEVINAELGIVKINFDKVALLHRYFESRELIDLSSLDLTVASNNDRTVAIAELYSNDVIAKYIDLSQTFIVLVDTPSLYVDAHLLSKTGLPGVYMSPELPLYPLRTEFGLHPEYWKRQEYEQWILSVTSSYSPNYLFETTQWQDLNGTDDVKIAAKPYRESQAHLIEIGTERRV